MAAEQLAQAESFKEEGNRHHQEGWSRSVLRCLISSGELRFQSHPDVSREFPDYDSTMTIIVSKIGRPCPAAEGRAAAAALLPAAAIPNL